MDSKQKITPKQFIDANLSHAKKTEDSTGISHIAILAQAALESAWGNAAPGNMFFGVKDTDGLNGNEQLLKTTEYSRRIDLKFPVIISITPVVRQGVKLFKYVVKDYFRKYETPEECFTDHAKYILNNRRYSRALLNKSNPYKFIEEIASAGYATDPNYAKKLKAIAELIETLA